MKNNYIALLTDFGIKDPFVGMMKGVILSRLANGVNFIDLTHEVPAQDIRCGAFFLQAAVPYLPPNTLVIAVVDPGVGSLRKILWGRTQGLQFLAPDNGLLSWISGQGKLLEIRDVTNRNLFLEPVSATFHGRDIFAPLAAMLCAGLNPQELGPEYDKMIMLPPPLFERHAGYVEVEILGNDCFGNCWTSLPVASFPQGGELIFEERAIGPLRNHYAEVAVGQAMAVSGSFGVVELTIRNGDFASCYGAKRGMRVRVYCLPSKND